MTYNDLVNEYGSRPREIHTSPINGSTPKWFYVYAHQGEVYIASGKEHRNVCNICPDRKLKPAEFSVMLDIYSRRKRGVQVSQEAGKQSINASYWFGIFRDLGV